MINRLFSSIKKFGGNGYSKILQESPINKEYTSPIYYIEFDEGLPFTPYEKQIIYVENHYSQKLNEYISKNYEKILRLYKEKGCDFIYIPKEVENINIDSIGYLNPCIIDGNIEPNRIDTQTIFNILLSYCDVKTPILNGLLQFFKVDENHFYFDYYPFSNLNDLEIWEQLRAYLHVATTSFKRADRMYSLAEVVINENYADNHFDPQAKQIIAEIKERIDALKLKGINELVIKRLFDIEERPKLSRLLITPKYEIILPDYNDMEIFMYPLPKAVFFLFLNHPEGILFKHLPEYRDELIALYKKISGRENIKDMEKSINDVVNPTLNSINEKCSRIREAFIKHFDESLAQNYFITGERATPKKIMLERELVILDKVELKVDVVKTPFEYTIYNNNNHDYIPENGEDDDLPF